MLPLKNRIFLFFAAISFLLFVDFSASAESKKQDIKIFKGKVVDISQKHITLDRTNIALPKEVKVLDARGHSIHFGTVKKGDYVIVEVDKDRAVIKIGAVIQKPFDEASLPR